MPTPSPPWVQPQKFTFNHINDIGQIVINSATSPFYGRLDNIFACNEGNGPVTFYLSVQSDSISYPRITVNLAPNEQRGVWDGEIEYIMPGETYFVHTDAASNFVTCSVNYVIYNELTP